MTVRRMQGRWRLGAVIAVAVAVLVGIAVSLPVGRGLAARALDSLDSVTGADDPGREPQPIPTADLGGSGPGALVSAMTMPGYARTGYGTSTRSARVVYRSTNGDTGAETVVSGTVFTPLGDPPEGGWPVVSLGHGTTGIDEPCAPSLSASLLAHAEPVSGFIKNGYAVALADYQGLGADGIHPYTDARTAGRNVIDAVRALRNTFPGVSTRWLAFGGSQGGGAAWSAAEQAADYAPDMDLVGAVANSPSADLTGLVDKAQAGELTTDQLPSFQAVIEALARLHPEVNRDDYRRGAAAKYWDTLSSCSGHDVHDRGAAVKLLEPGEFAPRTPAAADLARDLLARWALPQQRLTAPLSVVYGSDDTYIDARWTTAALERACALGGTITYQLQPGKGHGTIDIRHQFEWMADRFAGRPVTSDCP